MQRMIFDQTYGEKDIQAFILNKSPKVLFDLIWPNSNKMEQGSCSRNCNTQTLYPDLNHPNQAFGECVANC